MEPLSSVVKCTFKKHWKAISHQIYAVNSDKNPKRAFLFDCGKVDIAALSKLIKRLKEEEIICKDISIATLREDFFILNKRKFQKTEPHILINVSGSLNNPVRIENSVSMFNSINKQLESSNEIIAIETLEECIPTVFGYLINYPILYWHDSSNDNCLGLADLKVFQVYLDNTILISFSVPNKIFEEDPEVQTEIELFLTFFVNNREYEIRNFIANHASVIL